MCELFGLTSKNKIRANEYLSEFYKRSDKHPDGWGLAVFRGVSVSLEKEPVKATKSSYLNDRLSWDVEAKNLMAHIRLATIGYMNYSNCHPFVWDDDSDRTWTLIHNGTIFENDIIAPYFNSQEGTTDSEGVLLYLVDLINKARRKAGKNLKAKERFDVINEGILNLSPCGKLNIILFDGETMYVHCNFKNSLYYCKLEESYLFATKPLENGCWENIPLNTLLGFQSGELVFEGTKHDNEFFEDAHDMSLIYLAYSGL